MKKILIRTLVVLLILVVVFLVVIGPWPVYSTTNYRTQPYYIEALQAMDADVAKASFTKTPGALQAGWAKRDMTPTIGTPLGGYGNRKGAASTGVHDPLYVRALALSDGADTVVLVGSDMLIVPPNIAELVREAVSAQSPLTEDNLYFTASHTHCGTGAFAPGLAGRMVGGKFQPEIPGFIADQFSAAILEAYENMEPAALAHDSVQVPELIRNRARDATVDDFLDYLVVKQQDGDTCITARYSAHPTIYGGSMLEFSAEFPGALMRNLEKETGADVMYLGGALGSMGHRAPEAPTPDERVEAMGRALAEKILPGLEDLEFNDHVEIAALGIPLDMPSAQMRPLTVKWRVSPLVTKILNVPSEGWFQMARVGDIIFIGGPYDMSGEIALEWRFWTKNRDYDLWTTSFNGAYCGYLSPDRYYLTEEPPGYEMGPMNWFGPDMEAEFTDLLEHGFDLLTPAV